MCQVAVKAKHILNHTCTVRGWGLNCGSIWGRVFCLVSHVALGKF